MPRLPRQRSIQTITAISLIIAGHSIQPWLEYREPKDGSLKSNLRWLVLGILSSALLLIVIDMTVIYLACRV